MTETFVASNGLMFDGTPSGAIAITREDEGPRYLRPCEMTALREYFQAERDKELGRVRDVVDPDWVAYPDEDERHIVMVLSERAKHWATWSRWGTPIWPTSKLREQSFNVAQRYFAANPLPEPEPDVPWLDAAPGDVWVLTIDGSERLFRRSQHGLYSIEHGIPLDKWVPENSVTDGKRIWPVDAEGDGDE